MSGSISQPSFDTVSKDDQFVCPYDPVHIVSAKRFAIHLTKCRKIHNAKEYVRCPFNARHEVPKQELAYHISKCPDKEVIRQDISAAENYERPTSRPLTPPPSQGLFVDNEEDWDSEATNEAFIPAIAQTYENKEKVDSYAVVQAMHEIQSEIHAAKPTQVELSKMTPAQRKNYKRSLKRQQKRAEEGGEEEKPELSEQEKIDLLIRKHQLVVDAGGFVDFISGLNIYCQQNRINPPKYDEAPGVNGGFGFRVIIRTDIYKTNKYCRTKKEAKQNAAMVAMLAMDIQFDSGPVPGRKNNPLSANERERMRQTQEKRLLLHANRETKFKQQPLIQQQQQQQPQQPQSAFIPPPSVSQTYCNGINQPMENLSVQEEDDGWTTVPKKSAGRGVNPVFDYSMKVAGRGRGRAFKK